MLPAGKLGVKSYWTVLKKETNYLIARLWFSFWIGNGIFCRVSYLWLWRSEVFFLIQKPSEVFFFIQKPQQNSYPGRCRAPIQPETDPGHDDYQTGGYVDLDAGLAGLVPTLASNPFRRRPNGEIVVRRLLEGSSSSWNSSVVRGFFAPLLALGLFEAQRESVAKKLQKRKRYVTLEKATGIFKLYSQGLKRAGIHSVVHSSPYSYIYLH